MSLLPDLYERLTGRPWTTARSCAAEFGPPPGAVHAEELARYSDADLVHRGAETLAVLRDRRAVSAP